MIQDETVKRLTQISTPKYFKKDEYVCFEGQPGNEMYVVLKGCVGVYVISALCTFEEVAKVMPGDFFGEMSIFDKLPRSASCVALEDTVCIAIDSSNLSKFISACPEMAEKIIINMSERIRRLNDKLYKSKEVMLSSTAPAFTIPKQYSCSHDLREQGRSTNATESVKAVCPLCGESITVVNVRQKMLNVKRTDSDRRVHYYECEPLWYYVYRCPHCLYSNHYLEFFKVYSFTKTTIKELTEQHAKEMKNAKFLITPFDRLFVSYLQAIHINTVINPGNNVLVGRMWLYLYWLFSDTEDRTMKAYCCNNALEYLLKAYNSKEKSVSDDNSRQSLALTLANLYLQTDNRDEASRMCAEALSYPDQNLRSEAYSFKNINKLK